jgi:SAM-dependent methyltransferase
MQEKQRVFSHVPNFTGYMKVVADLVMSLPGSDPIVLDLPAGNGLLSEYLRNSGRKVTSADINSERPDYVYANMEQPLPFANATFDVIVCLEGIEHVIEPNALVREMCRILKPGGCIVLSMPNVQSLYSRLEFLLTGTMYQFNPSFSVHARGRIVDRGHISPVSLAQLDYMFGECGLELVAATGDKIKKKILFPLYGLLWLGNLIAINLRMRNVRRVTREQENKGVRNLHRLYSFMLKSRPLLSRSLVTVWRDVRAPQ